MKNKLLSVLLAIFLMYGLCACGSDVPVYEETIIENQSDEDELAGDDYFDGDELAEDGYFDEDDYFDEDESDEDDYFDETYSVNEDMEAKGIIAMICDSSNYHLDINEIIISINPDNGQTQCIAEFSHREEVSSNLSWENFRGYANFRNRFSKDYTKRAVTKGFFENNSYHAGWIDVNGKFFDVSEATGEVPDSDFADPLTHEAYGFTWDGKFVYHVNQVFSENGDGYFTYHIADPDDIFEGSYVEEKLKKWDEHIGLSDPDLYPTDWLDDTHCLADKGGIEIDPSMLEKDSVIYNTETGEITKYIPGESRNNWSGVASPDGKQIAFLSIPKPVSTEDVSLYITSPEGGEPKKLEVETIDEWKLRLERNSVATSPSRTVYCTLLDWK